MSSIGSIGGSTSSLSLLLERLAQGQQINASATDSSATTAATSVADDVSNPDLSGLKEKVDAAVQEAVKNFDKSGSLSDLLKTIRQTVDNTLKANGVDVHQMRPHGPPPGGNMGPPPSGQVATDDQSGVGQATDTEQLKQELIDAILHPDTSQNSVQEIMAQIFQVLPKGSAIDASV